MKYPSVLCVEDDVFTSRIIKRYLEERNIITHQAFDIGIAYTIIAERNPDVIILDLSLPSGHALNHLKEIKKLTTASIIVYTSENSMSTELKSLNMEVDDFVLKERGVQILYQRILRYIDNSLTRRVSKNAITSEPKVSVNDISLDRSSNELSYNGNTFKLTKTEIHILHYLFTNFDDTVSKDEISFLVNGYAYDGCSRGIDLQIFRLRTKLKEHVENKVEIKTIRGKGYRLVSGLAEAKITPN